MEQAITVAQLNRQAKFILQEHFTDILVTGEVSNLSRPRSGHLYFTLKDEQAQVRCAFFRGRAANQRYQLREGDAVLVKGQVSLYEGRGDYQIIVSGVKPQGDGALQIAFAALKRKLEAAGLFAAERKRALPEQIQRLGVITSASGAALQDILQVLARRDPGIEVWVYACTVQGKEGAASVRKALGRAVTDGAVDALLLARGGGSAEDLWCFNDEALAMDIAQCPLPIVSAVGHETDFTIADFVADVRAPTPSAGAELLSNDQAVWRQQLIALQARLGSLTRRLVETCRLRVSHLAQRLRHPRERLQEQQQRLDDLDSRLRRAVRITLSQAEQQLRNRQQRLSLVSPQRTVAQQRATLQQWQPRLHGAMQRRLEQQKGVIAGLAHSLHQASPLATLDRGYSITLDADSHRVIRSIDEVTFGDHLEQKLGDGSVFSTVTTIQARPRGDAE